jgi:hypothetical protein
MIKSTVAGVAANIGSLVCIAVAYTKRDDLSVEGAYLNRSVGEPAYAGVVSSSTAPWLVAAAALVVVGTLLLARPLLPRSEH